MLTENNYHHHNSSSMIPARRTHYAPYSPSSSSNTSTKSTAIPTTPVPPTSEFHPSKFDLHHAVRMNDVPSIILFHGCLRQQPSVADTFLLDSKGHTPLYTAIANNRLAIVDLLLHLGHNPVGFS